MELRELQRVFEGSRVETLTPRKDLRLPVAPRVKPGPRVQSSRVQTEGLPEVLFDGNVVSTHVGLAARTIFFGGERRETLEEDFPVTSEQMSDGRLGDSISAASDARGSFSEQQLRRQSVHHVTRCHSVTARACATRGEQGSPVQQ